MEKTEFLEKMTALVEKYAGVYGITVHSPIIAQAVLESGWGKSKLAKTYNNYFGLKCGSKWTGGRVNLETIEEYEPGEKTTEVDEFRTYSSMEEGVKGYFDFINRARYENLKGITDPKTYLETIKADGYATDSAYVEKAYKIVTTYELTKYDKTVENVDKNEEESGNMGYSRQKIVDTAESWVGKNEADGSYMEIINTYNSYTGTFPRGIKMKEGWPWCACTWSAEAIKNGYTAIMPIEISCYYLIEKAKKMGIWVENDAYVPKPGDAILYDWDDNGVGDNIGAPKHIGTVTYVNEAAGYMVVTEGNYSKSVKKRTISINGRYIRGFITPKYDNNTVSQPANSSGKSISTIAHEVIAGQWGNNPERAKALAAKGYDVAAVQAEVNRILNGSAATTDKKQPADQPIKKTVKATCGARSLDKSLSGTYVTTDNLYCRNDAGKNKKALCLIPKGTQVHNYGYYTAASGVKWLYITTMIDGVEYIGFSSSGYLRKTK